MPQFWKNDIFGKIWKDFLFSCRNLIIVELLTDNTTDRSFSLFIIAFSAGTRWISRKRCSCSQGSAWWCSICSRKAHSSCDQVTSRKNWVSSSRRVRLWVKGCLLSFGQGWLVFHDSFLKGFSVLMQLLVLRSLVSNNSIWGDNYG